MTRSHLAALPSAGGTTLIRRVLEGRADKAATPGEGATATVAVMVRLLPAPKALLVVRDASLRQHMERRITPNVLDVECVADDQDALRRFDAEYHPVVFTDSRGLIHKLRLVPAARAPYIIFVAEADDPEERAAGILLGADECVGRRVTDCELEARIRAARHIAELESVLRIVLEENRKLSATDDLTHAASRRFFGKHFPREVERAARYKRALSVILCDIDHFKKINDRLGHAAGDEILEQFGPRLQQALRPGSDWLARIGGEEFAVVMPETGYQPALDIARKLRAGVSHVPFKAGKKTIQVTASFGLCGLDCVPSGEARLAKRVLKIADAALYESKKAGRNRVTATHLKTLPRD